MTLRKRTQAQRDAINAHAAAYPKPLSPRQQKALAAMAFMQLSFGRVTGRWHGHLQATVDALERKRLCRIEGKQRPRAVITAAGKRELARHRQ